MRSSPVLAIVLLGAGLTLLIWGVAASDSLSSQASEWFQGAPSDKAIALKVGGALVGGFGLVRLLRRAAT
jgi:threonine/homoserine/homoserine lactone efflux protein